MSKPFVLLMMIMIAMMTAPPVFAADETGQTVNTQNNAPSAANDGSAPPPVPALATPGPSLLDALSKSVPGFANEGQEAIEPMGADALMAPGEPTPEEAQANIRSKAFEAMMRATLPMDPPELREAFERIDINQKAIEEPLAYPKPEIAFTTISLDPGTTPLTFKLATGHVTTVSFLDVTGQPWPIKDVTWAGNFDVKSAADGSANMKFPVYPNLMQIIPMSEYAYGNMAVRLVGLSTPVTFTLRTNREVVQYRLDLRVPENGPLALPPIINTASNTLEAGSTALTRIMEGIPPSLAQKMMVDGVDPRTTAYQVEGTLYVRTPLTLLSPGWNNSVRSADGMNVYALSMAPVLLLSDQGQMVRASISEQKEAKHD